MRSISLVDLVEQIRCIPWIFYRHRIWMLRRLVLTAMHISDLLGLRTPRGTSLVNPSCQLAPSIMNLTGDQRFPTNVENSVLESSIMSISDKPDRKGYLHERCGHSPKTAWPLTEQGIANVQNLHVIRCMSGMTNAQLMQTYEFISRILQTNDALEMEARCHRTAAGHAEAQFTWCGTLPNRSCMGPYSSKVFLGGLPWDICNGGNADLFVSSIR
ncbi:uncharacterized protein LOC135841068 isoform X2 [Planococcus citri]|uniref:uncharacterized protein LOC135841068 isoform X2 n=1 Tax=Planococcus citri TaxID=170843 RepID=UPI0031F82901